MYIERKKVEVIKRLPQSKLIHTPTKMLSQDESTIIKLNLYIQIQNVTVLNQSQNLSRYKKQNL